MKKILYVASTSNHLITFHLPYIEELKKHYEVKIMAKDEENNFADYDIDFTKRIISKNHIKTLKVIKQILESEKFDVVILNTSLASFLVRLAIKKSKHKSHVINIVHGYFFGEQTNCLSRFFYCLAEKSIRNQTDDIIVMNNEDYDLVLKHKLCKGRVAKINGMGIDDSRFEGIIKNIEYSSVENPKFVFVGELSKRKNQMFLIKFISRLKNFGIKAELKLVGYGSYYDKLQKLIIKKGLENQIQIVGYDRNINKYLQEADYYICASKIEGMPFNILEAMYAGCVVLSSDIKGSVDLIKDFETGILYKLDDLEDLVYKFRILNNSLMLKQKISKEAHAITEKYLLKNIFEENIKIIEGFIENHEK